MELENDIAVENIYEGLLNQSISNIEREYEQAIKRLGLEEYELKMLCEKAIKNLKEKGIL